MSSIITDPSHLPPVIQLASVGQDSSLPLVRSLIFRSFIFPFSNPAYSPILVAATDIRSPETIQLISNMRVQLLWWIEGAQEQFRLSGVACLVPAPSNQMYQHFKCVVETAPSASTLAMLVNERFDWEKKRKDTFGGLGSDWQAAWCRPAPGSRLVDDKQAKKWPKSLKEPAEGDKRSATRKLWSTALDNFALVLIEPNEVDYLQLGVVPNKRTRYWREPDSSWQSESLVPDIFTP